MPMRRRPALGSEYPLNPRARWGWDGAPSLRPVGELLAAGDYEPAVAAIVDLGDWAATIPRTGAPGTEPQWENDYWGTLDALAQCAALKQRDPQQYLEIGSGWSTRFAARAIRDFGLRTQITAIDPDPRAELPPCRHVPAALEDADLTLLTSLTAGDVVLVDGSHVARMNSDATVFFTEVMPQLPAGVLVGIDDVFLPDDYPPTWTGRGYGEQYLLAAFLLGGAAGWTVRFPGWWLTDHWDGATRFEALWPAVENRFGRHAASFWLEKTG